MNKKSINKKHYSLILVGLMILTITLISRVNAYSSNSLNYLNCYQEDSNSTNSYDSNCNLNYSGTYSNIFITTPNLVYDGNYSSCSSIDTANNGLLYITYYKPLNSSGAIWRIKDTFDTNVTIPNNCFNYYSDKVLLKVTISKAIGMTNYNDYACYNGSYNSINKTLADFYGTLCEESIYWNGTLTTENLTYSGNQNITRYLNVPQNKILTNAYINLTGLSSSNYLSFDSEDSKSIDGYSYIDISGNPSYVDNNTNTYAHLYCGGACSSDPYSASDHFYEYTSIYSDNFYNYFTWNDTYAILQSQDCTSPRCQYQLSIFNYSSNSWKEFYLLNSSGSNINTVIYISDLNNFVNNKRMKLRTYVKGYSVNPAYNVEISLGNGVVARTNLTTSFYPTNVSILIGNSQIFNYSNIFNISSNTNNFANSINSYLNTCTYSSGYCQVPFTFHSDSAGIINYNNLIFNNSGILENSVTYNSITSSFSTENFKVNLTYDSNLGLNAFLVYNNTNYTATITGSGNNVLASVNIGIPSVSTQTKVPFYWMLGLSNGTTIYYNLNTYNQTINPIGIDNCSVNSIMILNYTIYDEDTQGLLGSSGNTFESDIKISSTTNPNIYYEYNISVPNKNPISFCISNNTLNNSNFRMDVTTKYQVPGYVSRYNYIQNYLLTNSNPLQNINLYDLLTNESQIFTITYKDSSYLPVEGAVIDLQRQYISQGTFKSVENSITDAFGTGTVHLILNDVIYNIIIKKNGVILETLYNVNARCSATPCEIDLNSVSGGNITSVYQNSNNLVYNLDFNKNTRTYTLTFTTTDGSSTTMNLTSIKFDANLNETICSNSLTSSSGTITCIIPEGYQNFSVQTSVYQNNNFLQYRIDNFNPLNYNVFGYTGLVLGAFAFLCLGLCAVLSGGVAVIILSLIGVVFIGLMNLVNIGGFIGISATILYFVVAGLIIIYKLSKGRN